MRNTKSTISAGSMKTLREGQSWTRKQMADKLGVSERTVEGWELGRLPSKTALILLNNIINPT